MGGAGGEGGDIIGDFQDDVDKLRFKKFIADDIIDFTIVDNGLMSITLSIGSQYLVVQSSTNITLTNSDFLFLN